MKQIITLVDESAARADHVRCSELRRFLDRLFLIERIGLASEKEERGSREAAMRTLADKGLLSFAQDGGEVEVSYVPSRQSSQTLATAKDGLGFPLRIHEKQVAVFRTSAGAIFRFPHEEKGEALDVFITDWSPCPAACAVAVHRHHPFIAGLPRQDGDFFTGRFVRHPLTGDLLPVWVADWVKSDFGTGAVLVNPAHDIADLRFGRRIGLPIRFALVPVDFDGEQQTWPVPPVIKSGKTIKTGPYDGLSVSEATGEYFRVLERRGLAERYVDRQVGRITIARLASDEAGSLLWDERCAALSEVGNGTSPSARRVAVLQSRLLDAIGALDKEATVVAIATTGASTNELLFLRLLHQDVFGKPLRVDDVVIVHRTQESKAEASDEVLRAAVLVSAQPAQVAVLRQQIIEQVQRFLRVHQQLLARETSTADGHVDERRGKSLREAKEDMLHYDPSRAFTTLAALQKQLAESGGVAVVESEALRRYFVLAHVLLDVALPDGIDASQVWAAI